MQPHNFTNFREFPETGVPMSGSGRSSLFFHSNRVVMEYIAAQEEIFPSLL